jgi:hypothetical protein
LLSDSLKDELRLNKAEKLAQEQYENWTMEVYNSLNSKGVVLGLNWYHNLNKVCTSDHYRQAKENALVAVEHFKQGQKSQIGTDFLNDLSSNFNFFGFSPNIIYVKESSKDKEELSVEWGHPFSQPTLCYINKASPYMVITNGNIDFNETRLSKNPENLRNDYAIKSNITNVAGITG